MRTVKVSQSVLDLAKKRGSYQYIQSEDGSIGLINPNSSGCVWVKPDGEWIGYGSDWADDETATKVYLSL